MPRRIQQKETLMMGAIRFLVKCSVSGPLSRLLLLNRHVDPYQARFQQLNADGQLLLESITLEKRQTTTNVQRTVIYVQGLVSEAGKEILDRKLCSLDAKLCCFLV
jgi:hypothetical protein